MIQEAYISDEVAKLLKEKGFNEPVTGLNKLLFKEGEKPVLKITQQKAMRWLRKVHNKHCDIGYDIDLKWFFQIIDLKETVEYDYPEPKYYHAKNETGFNTYEEAVEAALKYCLENLI